MKNVVLTSLSLMMLSTSPVLADDRSSAGAATPVKLGGGDRTTKPAASQTTVGTQGGAGAAGATSTAVGSSGAGATSTTAGSSGAAGTSDKTAAARPKIPFGSWRNPSSNNYRTGFSAPGSTTVVTPSGINIPGTKTAFGGKGLIPPPPTTLILGPPLIVSPKITRKAKGKTVPADKMVTVGSAGPFVLLGHQRNEQFAGSFNWNPDQAGDTLTFKANYSPIGSGTPHFNWLRILLGSQIIADERSLRNKTSVVIDLTGKVDNGINQFVIDGQGDKGATFDWKLTTPRKCKLTSVDPDEVVVGKDLTLKGQYFDTIPSKDIVSIGSKTLLPTTATQTELKVRIPKDFTPGEYMVKVTVDGLSSHEIKVTIRGIPELTGTNFNGVPPGATLVVFGKNFSKKMSDNQVTFDGVSAQVVAATTDQLTVIVPNFSNEMQGDTARLSGQVGIPIRVKVGKIESVNSVPINIGNSLWQDPGFKGGPDVPQVPVDWRRLLEN